METMLLNDGVVTLRALEPEDLDVLFRWENDTRLWRVGSTVAPYSRKQLWDYIENYDGDIFTAGQLRLMITRTSDGAAVGTIDIYDFDVVNRRAFVGVLVDEECRGEGYGLRSLRLVADYCRRVLGMHQLAAVIPEDNRGSRTLFEEAGFATSGRFRSWLRTGESYRDAYFCQLLLV